MLLIDCPYCGKRPELEFSHGGQAHIARPANPSQVSAQEWTQFLYMRDNLKGIHAERWRHTHGCGRFFNALRDTTSDHFLATYRCGEPMPALDGRTSAVADDPAAADAVRGSNAPAARNAPARPIAPAAPEAPAPPREQP